MGFVSFPANDSEPAKSGPGVAQHLAHVYKEYLYAFDNVYIQSVIESKRKMQATGNSNANNQVPVNAQTVVSGLQNTPRLIPNARQMQTVIQYAHVSAQELRNRGIAERIIQFVEAHREQLQHNAKMQQSWRGNIAKPSLSGQSGPPQDQDRIAMTTFSSQQNTTLPPALQHHPVPRPGQFMAPQQPGVPSMPGGGNNMNAQFPRQPQGPSMNGVGLNPPRVSRPTPEQIHQAQNFITKVKQEFMTRSKCPFKRLESDF
jgi:hypothetical protein